MEHNITHISSHSYPPGRLLVEPVAWVQHINQNTHTHTKYVRVHMWCMVVLLRCASLHLYFLRLLRWVFIWLVHPSVFNYFMRAHAPQFTYILYINDDCRPPSNATYSRNVSRSHACAHALACNQDEVILLYTIYMYTIVLRKAHTFRKT